MWKKIWSDPVWSKVIATIIGAILFFIFASIKSWYDEVSLSDVFTELLDYKVKVIYLVFCFLLFLILRGLFKKEKSIPKKTSSIYTPKQAELRKFNKLKDDNVGVLFKWDVHFSYSNVPFIAELTPFCTKHGDLPIRFVNGYCPMHACANGIHRVDLTYAKNHIESILIHEYEK